MLTWASGGVLGISKEGIGAAPYIRQGMKTQRPLTEHPSRSHLLLTCDVPTAETHRPRACTAQSRVGPPGDAGIPQEGWLSVRPAPITHGLLPPTHSPALHPPPSTALGVRTQHRALGHSDYRPFRAVSPLRALCVPLNGLFSFQQSDGGVTNWFTQARFPLSS